MTFAEVRRFFESSMEVRATAAVHLTPHYRGRTGAVQTPSQLVDTFQYGMDPEEASAYEDESAPVWRRIFYGRNTWPDPAALPGFRPMVEALRAAYLELHHELGGLICESLGADAGRYDELFDRRDPCLAAFLSYGYSLAHIERGGVAENKGAASGPEGRQRVEAELRKRNSRGAHVDITPFITLLTMDRPGLQVLDRSGVWVDMPVIPGAVCINVGSTLQHLSSGRMVATVHRVNTALIPEGDTRVSLPFFLLPRFDVTLQPFDGSRGDGGTDYATSDRGMLAAFNRMELFPTCTRRWWAAEHSRIKDAMTAAQAREDAVAKEKVVSRGAQRSAL